MLIALSAFLVVAVISWITSWYLLLLIGIGLILSVLAPFVDTPQGQRTGKLIYYSPLFITEKEKKGKVIIHGGTLFDYYYVVPRNFSGNRRRRLILRQYAIGLLNLLEAFENRKEEIELKGTSYIINKRTAKKLGFHTAPTDGLQQLILLYNYIPVTWSYSIAKGKLSFPSILKAQTFVAPLTEIDKNKAYLKRLVKI